MSQELSLVLKTPVEELIPAMLAWNNAELLEAVELDLQEYDGIEYTDDQMDAAKKHRATLNAFIKSMNDERIRIGKVYAAPYEKFKGEVDEVISAVKKAVESIDSQVKAHELARQQKKEADIRAYFESVIGCFESLIPFERVKQSRWLNASTSMKSIKAEIDKLFEDAKLAMSAIEALNSADETAVKAYYLRTLNLSEALMENNRLAQEKARIAELKAKRETEATSARAESHEGITTTVGDTPTDKLPTEATQTSSAPKLMTICFKVEATAEQFGQLRSFLVSNGIKYSKI